MTKEEAKTGWGKTVKSSVRFEKRFKRGHEGKLWMLEKKPVEGILVGGRTYQNGTTDYSGDCWCFTMTDCFEVALIVPGWRKKPVPVPLKECFLAKKEER